MKNLILIPVLVILSSTFNKSLGQTKSYDGSTANVNLSHCDSLTMSEDNDIITYFGNVNLQADKLQLLSAEKVVFNTKTKILSAYSPFKYTFDGSVVTDNNSNKLTQELVYTKGDAIVYLK